METKEFICYCRVSTAKQGRSGLGLEAQRDTIMQYLNAVKGELLREFVEVESGKNNERPELAKALQECKLTGATLVVAKLDRLSRNIHFITALQESKTDFIVCDFPTANQFTLHIFAALAQYERELISQRTRAALEAKKARGAILGKPENLSKASAEQGRAQGRRANLAKADQFAAKLRPKIEAYRKEGVTGLHGIAARLNRDHILTASGKRGAWTPTAVKNLLARL